MEVLETCPRPWQQTHLERCPLQHPADVVFLLQERSVDQRCSFGHDWMVMLLQRLDHTRTGAALSS